jgi:nucleoside-diphosphate-sugar epimerase
MRNFLILGASGGIGSVVAKHFLDAGHGVTGTYNHTEPVEALIGNANFTGLKINITDQSELANFAPPPKI